MQKIEKINYFDLIEVNKKINNPFSREIFISTIKKEYGNGYTKSVVWTYQEYTK